MTKDASAMTTPDARARGFTLIEMLITIAIILVLAGLVVAAMSRALRQGGRVQTTFQLQAIGTAIEAFETDFRYLPPLLTRDGVDFHDPYTSADRGAFTVPQAVHTNASALRDALVQARFASEFSLGVYLLGWGDLDGEPTTSGPPDSSADDDGKAFDGIRSPGPDRSWGGAANRADHDADAEGQVYGPYLDPASVRLDRTDFDPDADGVQRIDEVTGLYRIVDRFDNPIRYYQGWPTTEIDAGGLKTRTLDFTPVELRSRASVDDQIVNGEPNLSLDGGALNARYGLLTAGARPVIRNGEEVRLYGDRLPTSTSVEAIDVGPGALDGVAADLGEVYDALLECLETNVRYLP